MSFTQDIEAIAKDQTHGSSVLAERIMQTFLTYRPDHDEIEWAMDRLQGINSSMRIVHHLLSSMERWSGKTFFDQLKKYREKWESVDRLIATRLEQFLHQKNLTILIHSYSGMVIRVLLHLNEAGYKIKLIQTESYPGGEGNLQAQELTAKGFDVKVIPDQQATQVTTEIKTVLLGVDHFDDESFVNKTGSGEIVESCKKNNVPVFILGDTRKQVEHAVPDRPIFEQVKFQENTRLINEN